MNESSEEQAVLTILLTFDILAGSLDMLQSQISARLIETAASPKLFSNLWGGTTSLD